MDDAVPEASPTGGTSESIPTDESSYLTNNQVEGVDEADMVKSDGEFIYVAYGKGRYSNEHGDLNNERIFSHSFAVTIRHCQAQRG